MYKYLLTKFIFPLSDLISGGYYWKHLKKLTKYERKTYDKIISIQTKKLRQILLFSIENSAYYSRYKHLNLDNPRVVIKKFSTLTKKDFADENQNIITRKDTSKLLTTQTSGTTGPPSVVYYTQKEISIPRAIQTYWMLKSGFDFGDKILQTGISTQRSLLKNIKDLIFKTRYVVAFSHSENEILNELNSLRKKPRDFFMGYVSSLYLFALTAKKYNITDVKFKSVYSFGEKLLDEFKTLIEEVFHSRVIDTYGSSEGFMIALQCKHGRYHVESTHVFIEILDKNGKDVLPGEIGEVIVTCLDNFTTPLIRFRVGDYAKLSNVSECECGKKGFILDEIIGRKTELLYTPSGKYLTIITVVRIMKHVPNVLLFKFMQIELNKYELLIIPANREIDLSCETINNIFYEMLEETLNIEIRIVERIPGFESGKNMICENLMKS